MSLAQAFNAKANFITLYAIVTLALQFLSALVESASQRQKKGGKVSTEEFNLKNTYSPGVGEGTTPLSYMRVVQAHDFWEGHVWKTWPTRTLGCLSSEENVNLAIFRESLLGRAMFRRHGRPITSTEGQVEKTWPTLTRRSREQGE